MVKCEWCNKRVDKLNNITDSFEMKYYNVCDSCKESVDNSKCIECGEISSILIKGRCTRCYQALEYKKQKQSEEAIAGVSDVDNITDNMEFTEDEYERWITQRKTYSPNDIKNSAELKRIWIMVKLMSTGLTDQKVIDNHIDDIETLIDRCFSKLINNKCRLIIANSSEARKLIRSSRVIDHLNDVVIIEGN